MLSLVLGICAGSCIEEMEVAQPMLENDGETVLVPRVKSFTNQYITKSDYTGLETKITKIAVLVFDSDSKLVHLEEVSGESVILNKSMLNSSATQTDKLKSATVVMFANMNLADIRKGKWSIIENKNEASMTPEDLKNYICHFAAEKTVIPAPLTEDFEGFPMVGSTTCDLSATKAKSDPITVDLKILYAKVNFSITAEQGTENDEYEGVNVAFKLNRYSVHNASKATKLDDITASEETPDAATESRDYAFATDTDAKTCTPDRENQFTFYVAENRYNPYAGSKPDYPDYASLNAMGDIYPDGWLTQDAENEDVKTPEEETNGVKYFYDDLIQQYKPNLVEKAPDAAGKPTYVTLTGVYTDYRGTLWNVNYDIYLGKDNAHNFHVDRNSEYKNYITIKGIRNNDSYSDGQVWVDHRVDVTLGANQGADDCVTITRETLIDSHIEVRPLRVNLPENISVALLYLPKYDGVQIEEIKGGANENWIAIENNNGRVKDITQFSSNGKRKYFTTSLIEQLHLENNDETYGVRVNQFDNDPRKGQRYIQLQMDKETGEGDCAWIYIDENNSEDDRTATLELVFYNNNREAVMEEKFIIKQKGLHKIENQDLYIETYEEYLHTYDSQDLYTDPTKDYTQRGYNWGLLNTRISMNQYVRLSTLGSTNTDYPYDYFHSEDAEANASYRVLDVSEKDIDLSKNTGLHFTNNAGISQEMTIIDMNTRPESAIQYCLSKNKFRVDESDQEQHTMDIHWYLPDAYEMAQILSDGQEAFSDFKDNAYWTSQPSWRTPNGLNEALATGYILEDVDNARVVSLSPDGSVSHGNQTPRNELHRIRCAYSVDGIDGVDFSGTRAPEGIGAMRFYMRAWKDWNTGEKGYFSWLPKLDTIENVVNYKLPDTYDFPKDVSGTDQYFGKFVEGYGFEEDPSDSDNWDTERVSVYTSQVALHRWPGLTTSQIVEQTTLTNQKYYVLDNNNKKEETKGIDSTFRSTYTKDITQESLKPLDHLYENNDLNIMFLKGDNNANSPSYKYEKENKVKSKKTTRTWETPKYATNYKIDIANYNIPTPSGTVQLTSNEESQRKSRNGTISTNSNGYIYTSEAEAKTAGEKIIPAGAISPVVKTSRSYVTLYTYTRLNIPAMGYRWRYEVTYSLAGQQVPYYAYESGGKWVEVSPGWTSSENTSPPTADQLTLFGGNSFKITANNGNVISSVKIYFSDSNVVKEDANLLGSSVHKYLRFTKDRFTGIREDPPGMSYSGDGDKGTMTWSGDPTSEITFELMSYLKSYNSILNVLWSSPSSFEYKDSDSDSFAHSIVIDQIDVRYKKAE